MQLKSLLIQSILLGVGLSHPSTANIEKRSPSTSSYGDCLDPMVRKEWRTLEKSEQKAYLDAVQCFLKKPGRTSKEDVPGAESRYDDFLATHIKQTMEIHFVGHFLPWHRWFTAQYEKGLREECGYTGAQPYWDWTLDVGSSTDFFNSPVFDPVYGFGGNGDYIPANESSPMEVPGRTGGGCINDGPLKDMVVRLGPLDDVSGQPRCLRRDLSPYFASRYLGMNQTELTLAQPDFGRFTRVDDGKPSFEASGLHGGGHYCVGGTHGQMGDLYASPADPIFFMHHTNLDRVWWSWQMRNPEKRLEEISDPINYMDYENEKGGNVTLDFPMTVGVNAKDITVRETMNIKGGYLCYDYDELY